MRGTVDRADLEEFRSFVAQRLGLQFDESKQDFLTDVLRDRMEATGRNRFSSYEQLINSPTGGTAELQSIAEQLTVCETYFFRYWDHFRAFTEIVVPDRIQSRNHARQIRILSAGCASGEEAYSIAILIRERFPELASWDIRIHGIDINPAVLSKAAQARYSTWSLRDTPPELRSRYFCPEGRDFMLDRNIKAGVTFEERNLIEEDPSFWQREAFDMVFCRNVTMYFTPESIRSVMSRIANSLTPGGFLFLGHAETLRGISQEFHLRHTHETFYYQRREARESSPMVALPKMQSAGPSPEWAISSIAESDESWFSTIHRASERIVNLTERRHKAAAAHSLSAGTLTSAAPVPFKPVAWDRAATIELLQNERFSEATQLLRALPPEMKRDPDAQLLLAAVLTNSGDLPEAERVCKSVLDLDELNAGAHYLMALCREHAGDRDAALEHDRAAMYLDSAFAMPHLHIGLLGKRSADLEAARREFGRALELLAREDASRILLLGEDLRGRH